MAYALQRLLKRKASLLKLKKIKSAAADQRRVRFAESTDKEASMVDTAELMCCSEKEVKGNRRRRDTVVQGNKMKKRKQKSERVVLDPDGSNLVTIPTGDYNTIEQEMREWVELGDIPHPLLRALQGLKFYHPTEIQKRTILLVARGDNDIIGAAETVSVLFNDIPYSGKLWRALNLVNWLSVGFKFGYLNF